MYSAYRFKTSDKLERNMLMAVLGESGFNGFEEETNDLVAYVDSSLFTEDEMKALLKEYGLIEIEYGYSTLENTNWNSVWESQFEPVNIGNVHIRATFHPTQKDKHEIVIDPKMSFGTGHHPTTFLMIEQMSQLDFTDKKVLDFGSGTGILSVFAEQLGAKSVDAIDNEDWAYENCIENAHLNHCTKINPILGDHKTELAFDYDIILANINRHVILPNLAKWHTRLKAEGVLLLSGLLDSDETIVLEHAFEYTHLATHRKDGWIMIFLKK